MLLRFAAAILAVLLGAIPGRAHDPGLSTVEVDARAVSFSIVTGLSPADALHLLPAESRPASDAGADALPALRDAWVEAGRELWEVRSHGEVVLPRESLVQVNAADAVTFETVFPPLRGRVVLRSLKLPQLPPGHRQFILVADANGSTVAKKLLSAADPGIEVDLDPLPAGEPSAHRPQAVFGDFVKLGVEHIAMGYDHLLFLLGLLVVCRRFASMAVIVSCFTIAHSLTLGLATLQIVNLPSRLVEATIAASIVFVGVENLLRRGGEPRGRWALTFGFGLIHGFGFASVLRELGVGQDDGAVLGPLFAFNLGVEIGQIAIAALVLPLLGLLRRNAVWDRWITFAISALVSGAGLYWLLARTVLDH